MDCGTISRSDFLGKIAYFRDTILIVTRTLKRLELLLAYLKEEGISKPVYFVTYKELINSTFLSCKWRKNGYKEPVSFGVNPK
jgi:hypothetical protein